MADIVAKVVEIGLPYVVGGVKVQYRYLFRFGAFRAKLDKEVEKLKGVEEIIVSRVEADRNNGREIYPNVEKWLVKVSAILVEADKLMEEMQNKEGCFMGLTFWYPLSKKFEKNTLQIIELQEEAQTYEEVSPPRAHLSTTYVSSNDFVISKSSKAALDQIMEGLKGDESIKVIGLYGMGGVGKTTLAEQVVVSVSKLFEKVVMVAVSQTPDIMAIQDKVAAHLNFEFKTEKDVRSKAGALSLRMMQEKKILIVLDDIWNFIDLPEIGIAFTEEQKSCKLLITTRDRGVCSRMKCNKQIRIDVMCETEAWDLFKKRADLNDESPMIDIAREVAKECRGLPIAIVPLARALVDNTRNQWKHALQCLRNSNLPGINNIEDKDAYKCMKFSYDKLNGEVVKFCFLMCSLFPEDHEIETDYLVRYAWGLGICKDADTIEEARIKIQSSIDHLKDYCLLINVYYGNKVKMHDVVRHFALWIAFNVEKDFTVGYISRKSVIRKSLETYRAISLIIQDTEDLPSGLLCGNLKLLRLSGGEGGASAPGTFFKQLEALQVLTLNNCLLGPYLCNISICLRVLSLEECKVGDISSLGILKTLEILRFCRSDIRELPDEIGEMKDLKVLDLSRCGYLNRIPAGLIQKLSCLEELYVTGSKKPWEARGDDSGSSGKASLSELNSLSELKVLFLDRIGGCLLPDYFVLPNLTRYQFIEQYWHEEDTNPISKILEINEINETSLNAFKRFFSTAEHLVMDENEEIRCIVPEMESGVFNNLISLVLRYWKKMVCLIDTTVENVPTMAFLNLKELRLYEMPSLKELCVGQVSNEFLQKLETVSIQKCPKLCSIFQVQREEIRNEDNLMLFSTLVELILWKLPNLSCVWEGPTRHINLNRLTDVSIAECRKLKYIFSLSMARTLVHLKSLRIKDCDELEHIILEEEENGVEPSTSMSHLIFTRLETVKIKNCNKLKYVFPIFVAPSCLQQLNKIYLEGNGALEKIFKYAEGNHMEIELSHLEDIFIEGSPKLVNFSGGHCSSLSFPSLQRLDIKDCAIQFPRRLRLSGKQLEYASLTNVPKEWGNYILSQLIIGDLPNLHTLRRKDCDELEHIIEEEEENGLQPSTIISNLIFTRLETVNIENCKKLKYVFPIFLAPSCLQQLEDIDLNGNVALEQIFKHAEGDQTEIELSHLKILSIQGSPNLVNFSGGHCSSLSFPSLQNLIIKDCAIQFPGRMEAKQLQKVFLCNVPKEWGNYISSQLLIGHLSNLQFLHIGSLIGVEEVIRLEVDNQRSDLVLPIKRLVLIDLPQLVHICNCPSYTSIFQNLTVLKIYRCHKVSYILSPTLAQNLPMLEKLTVEDCKELVQVIGNDNEGVPNSLKLEGFPSLKEIRIKKCNKIKFVFPLSVVVGGLPNLEKLRIKECDGVEYVFGNETLKARKNSIEKEEVVLPKLENIVLKELPSLIGLSVAGYNIIISETDFQMTDCPNFKDRSTVSPTNGTTTEEDSEEIESVIGTTTEEDSEEEIESVIGTTTEEDSEVEIESVIGTTTEEDSEEEIYETLDDTDLLNL